MAELLGFLDHLGFPTKVLILAASVVVLVATIFALGPTKEQFT